MRLIFHSLIWLLGAAVVAALVGALLIWHLASRSLPDYEATWQVDDLAKPVQIVRDRMATPHIFAETDADAFFALGFAHAQDRLWQMEIARRHAKGRLSELFGPSVLPVDKLMRALDLSGIATRAATLQRPETAALLDAYARGVNARVKAVNERAMGRGAPEFFLYGEAAIAPWTPADSLAVMKLMALRMTTAAQDEARRARLLSALTPEQMRDIDPSYPEDATLALPPPSDTRSDIPALSPWGFGLGGASNAWAVDATRAASGASLLAADPHLWLSAPGVWTLAHISSPGFNVIGAAIPGIPAILMGRNPNFAWGLTTTHIDDQDLYIEELDPENNARYRTPDGWAEFETRDEVIRIAGKAPQTVTMRRSRHGPVIPKDAEFNFAAITPPGAVVAMAWTALDPEDQSLDAALRLMRARNVADGAAALEDALAPAQNVVMADRRDVAIAMAGRAPQRAEDSRSQGRTPSLGRIAENDWRGYMPSASSPRRIKPASGAVANANNRITDAAFPAHLTFDWPPPYRIRRIEERLSERRYHSLESFSDLQRDAVSGMARSVLPLIARDLWWGDSDKLGAIAQRRAEALERLADWTGEMSAHEPEPLIFDAWMRHLTRRLAEDELGALFPEFQGSRPLFVERVFHDVEGASRWCDVTKTPEIESCVEISRRALDDALAELTRRFGEKMSEWRWGVAHRAVHRHAPLGYNSIFGSLLNIEYESAGDAHSVLVGASPQRGPWPEENIHAPGFRMVVDFADPDSSVFAISTGASGHPVSKHYDDFNELWRKGDYMRMSLDPEDARAGVEGVTRLTPR